MKRRSCRPTLDTNRFSHCSLLPLLHSIHLLFSFFFFIFICLCFSCHHFTNNPPPLFTSLSSGPPCLPIPPSSVLQFLDFHHPCFVSHPSPNVVFASLAV